MPFLSSRGSEKVELGIGLLTLVLDLTNSKTFQDMAICLWVSHSPYCQPENHQMIGT